MNDDV